MKYAALSFSQNSGPPVAHMVDYRGNNYNGATGKTDITMVSMSPSSGKQFVICCSSIKRFGFLSVFMIFIVFININICIIPILIYNIFVS